MDPKEIVVVFFLTVALVGSLAALGIFISILYDLRRDRLLVTELEKCFRAARHGVTDIAKLRREHHERHRSA